MIDIVATLIKHGYLVMDLPPQSNKPIIATCDKCGKVRTTSKNQYRPLCHPCTIKGKPHTEETKALISAAIEGEKHPMFGRNHTEATKILMSIAKKGKTSPRLGKTLTEATKAATRKNHTNVEGANNPAWRGGISFKPYCIKFNNEYKEYIRNLFGNECFLCGLLEVDNGQKLDVHHKDYNKNCGCDGTVCKCVPLCISCHSKTGTDRDFWQALIMEMLRPIKAWIY